MTPSAATAARFGRRRSLPADVVAVGVAMVMAPQPLLGAVLAACVLRSGGTRLAGEPGGDVRVLGGRLAVALLPVVALTEAARSWMGPLAVAVATAVVLRALIAKRDQRRDQGTGLAEPTVLVGTDAALRHHVQQFAVRPSLGVRPVATAGPSATAPTTLPHLPVHRLTDAVALHGAVHVVVVSADASDELGLHVSRVRELGCRVTLIPPLGDHLTAAAEVVDVRGLPALSLPPRRRQVGAAFWAKRALDLVGACAGLLVSAPVLLVAAVAIKLEDGGPVLFRQTRVGRHGRPFTMWKLRSMVVDAETRRDEIIDLNEASGPFFKVEEDPRVTKVGRTLRRLSVDELPQLVNVLRGQMSLVGPRPCLPVEAAQAPEVFAGRQGQLPGITGLWQVAGRSWLPVEEGVRMDRAYVEGWTSLLDLRILLRTALVAFGNDRRPPVLTTLDLRGLDRRRYAAMVHDDQLHCGEPVDVSVVVVTHESAADIVACLGSVEQVPDRATLEIIVVDNASSDGTAALVSERFPQVRVLRKRRRDGFATNCNIGAVAASGRHVLLLNPDARLRPGALDRLVTHLDRNPGVGAAGPTLVYPDGRPQASARAFPRPLNAIVRRTPLRRLLPAVADGHLIDPVPAVPVRDVDWMLGAALLLRRSALEHVGGFDDGYRLYCEDIDLCWRLRESAWAIQQVTDAVVEHRLDELTTRRFLTWRTIWHVRSALRFVRLHGFGRPTPTIDLRPGVVRTPELHAAVGRLSA